MKRLLTFAGCMCLSAVLATAQTTATSPGQDMKTTPQTPTTDPNATGSATQEDMKTGTAVSGQSSVGTQGATGTQKEVKLEGCIQQQDGKYLLYSKKYKDGVEIVSSQDLSAHVGHEVKIKGNWTTPGSMASSQGMTHSAPHSAAHGTTSSTSSTSTSTTPSTTSTTTPGSTSSTAPDTSGTSASTSSSTTPGTSSASTPGSSTASTSDTSMQKPESDQPAGAARAIQASSVEMVSATCKMKDKNEQNQSTPR